MFDVKIGFFIQYSAKNSSHSDLRAVEKEIQSSSSFDSPMRKKDGARGSDQSEHSM